jgi:elongation factor Ts
MTITAKQVQDLRKMSGAGMMECKTALSESNGVVDKAFKILREKGIAKAEKKSSRDANEGLIGIKIVDNGAAIVEVNSETDFVSRNNEFHRLVDDILDISIEEKGNFVSSFDLAKDKMNEAVSKIGENLVFKRSGYLAGNVHSYMHNTIAEGLGKIGVILSLDLDNDIDTSEIGKNICMHIAASAPHSVSNDDLDESIINSEREIIVQQLKDSDKPDNILSKMIDGKLNKYLEEIVLLKQKFVINPELSIAKYLEDESVKCGSTIKIEKFIRFEIGK